MRFLHLRDAADITALRTWARKLIDDLNRSQDALSSLPGPYPDDDAAAAAGIRIGLGYIDTTGIARRRMT